MKLLAYLNSLSTDDQRSLAERVGTSVGYLRKQISSKGAFGSDISIAIERETGGLVTVADLRPEFAELLASAGYERKVA